MRAAFEGLASERAAWKSAGLMEADKSSHSEHTKHKRLARRTANPVPKSELKTLFSRVIWFLYPWDQAKRNRGPTQGQIFSLGSCDYLITIIND